MKDNEYCCDDDNDDNNEESNDDTTEKEGGNETKLCFFSFPTTPSYSIYLLKGMFHNFSSSSLNSDSHTQQQQGNWHRK